MPRFVTTLLIASLAASMLLSRAAAQAPQALPSADERYKVDLLLVVAHPDDEGAATPLSGAGARRAQAHCRRFRNARKQRRE